MAHGLGIHGEDRVAAIKRFCREKVQTLIGGTGPVHTVEELERRVCERLNLTIIEVWSDEDLKNVIETYARGERDLAFAGLKHDLDVETFATLIRRQRKTEDNEDQYVAVIDCRGEKGARRFFTRWHEIAHVLTLFEQLELPLHRSTVKKDPVEKMMDLIAADLGFFEPLFGPVLLAEVERNSGLTFDVAKKVRETFCQSASLEATLNACASQLMSPVILLQAAMGFKRSEERALNTPQGELFAGLKPVPQLRVAVSIPNVAARSAGLAVHQNMRVPEASVIGHVFSGPTEFESRVARENLNWWRSSDGDALGHAPVHVEAMKVRERAWAIITPVTASR